jgi:hypothetical protein
METSRRRFIQGTVGAAVATALATPFKLAYASGSPSGDFALDFTALGDADPYVNSNFVSIDGLPIKVSSGALSPSDANGSPWWGLRRYRFNGAMLSESTVRAKVQVGIPADADLLCAAILAADGSGYILNINQIYVSLMSVDTSGAENGLISGTAASAAPGDIFTLEWVPQTNTLTAYLNDSPIPNVSIVDSTYTSGLAFAFALDAGNVDASTMLAFAGDGSQVATVSGFLPAGHWVSAKMPLNIVHPRPDSETGAFTSTVNARHRLAYYDGINAIQYECPIVVQGGARPLVYQITAGPSWLNIGQGYGSAMYGILYGTPTAAISKSSPVTVTVRVWGQDQTNHVDVTFTLATSSSTTDFIFVNSGAQAVFNGVTIGAGNDSTGNGSITSPYASLTKVMGTSASQITFPGARVYMAGNQQWPVQSGSAYAGGFGVESTKVPSVYMTLPGANVTIDASLVQLYDAGTGWNDLYFSGSGSPAFGFAASILTINSGPSQPPSEHTFELYNTQRATWWNLQFTNPVSRSTDGNNCSSIMCSNSGAIKNYYAMVNISETGRTRVTGENSVDLLCVPFSVQNLVMEFCSATGAAPFGVLIKDSNRWVTVAYCNFHNTDNSLTLLFGGQTNNNANGTLYPGLVEACYNYIHGVMFFDFQGFANNGQYWSYRNTIYNDGFDYNYALGDWGPTGTGPYSSESDVLISRGQAISTSAAPITATNTEVQALWSGSPPPPNMPIDPTTGKLVNVSGGTQWATLYSKTAQSRGWEIG